MSNERHETPSGPILMRKYYNMPSIFTPQNLLREARRQKGLPEGQVPEICVLDPDGDLVDYVLEYRHATFHPTWACDHYISVLAVSYVW